MISRCKVMLFHRPVGLAFLAFSCLLLVSRASAQQEASSRTRSSFCVAVGTFSQDVASTYTTHQGLSDANVTAVAVAANGTVYAGTPRGLQRLVGQRWETIKEVPGPVHALAADGGRLLAAAADALWEVSGDRARSLAKLPIPTTEKVYCLNGTGVVRLGTDRGLFEWRDKQWRLDENLQRRLRGKPWVRQIAVTHEGTLAVAAWDGLFLRRAGETWHRLRPHDQTRSWSPRDVRGVAFDSNGRLWFASPQGVGCWDGKRWTLYTGEEGLPYNDFTGIAVASQGAVWFGTRIGAIRLEKGEWSYRQGRQWLPDDRVQALAAAPDGGAWFATAGGVGRIERRPMTLRAKAERFEKAIDRYHRRTVFGYVLGVHLARPGDTMQWMQHDSDNDGLWTSMYGAGECFAYAATGTPEAKERAKKAFRAVAFLSEVTQGGSHPAPPGFPARSILPTSGSNPNERDTPERDRERQKEDPLWKVIEPRWPTSADGKWYWKSDTSSDELDGHYFLYAQYYDHVAETEEEKEEVRRVVRRITDHLIEHGFQLVDHDGKPTRWARFSPEELNGGLFWAERGLNSLSILSYLKVAEHVCGDPRYRQAYERLIREHAYDTNVTDPKVQHGVGSGNQSDDEMALMAFYNLLKYERDPSLRKKYMVGLVRYWMLVRPERCPLFNYLIAAQLDPKELELPREHRAWIADTLQQGVKDAAWTLQRFPLNRIRWGYRNSHRLDIVRWPVSLLNGPGRGSLRNGLALPIDERFVEHWNHDPWRLDDGSNGTTLADGAAFLLPYYLGLHHRFLEERLD